MEKEHGTGLLVRDENSRIIREVLVVAFHVELH